MAPRPGGKKTVSAELDFMVQMQGIAGAISEFTGLTNKARGLNAAMIDFGDETRRQSSSIIETYNAQYGELVNIDELRSKLARQDQKTLEFFKEKLDLESPEDMKKYLDNLEEELISREKITTELHNASLGLEAYHLGLTMVESAGRTAFGALKSSLSGVASVEAEVGDGLNILQDSFMSVTGLFKKGLSFMSPDKDKNTKDQAKEALTFAAESMKIKEIRVAQLLFDEAVKSEKTGTVEKAKGALKEAQKGEGKSDIISRAGKIGEKVTKMGNNLQSAGGKMQQFSARMANMGKAGQKLGPVVGRVGSGFSRIGSIASRAGPAVAKLTAAIVAGGPVVWAAAAVVILTVGTALLSVAAAFRFLGKGVKIAIANMEEYRLVNYRALGSINELLNATYDVSMATGLSNKQSVAAIKALSHQGVTAQELADAYGDSSKALRDLAGMQGQFVRMTGASNSAVAQLQKRLLVGGVSMTNMQRTLDRTSMTMRKFGLTGDDANAVLGVLSTNLMDLNAVYNESDIGEYVDTMTELGAAAKRAGVDVGKALGQINSDLRGMKGGAATLMALGGTFDQLVAGGAKAGSLDNLVGGYEKALKMVEGMPKGLQDVALQQMGISGEMRAMLDAEKKRRDVLVANYEKQGMTHAEAIAAMQEQLKLEGEQAELRKQAMDDYNSSINTLTQQLQDMLAPIQAEAAKAVLPLVEGLIAAVKYVAPMVKELIGSAIEYIMAAADVLWRILEPVIPILAVIGKAIFNLAKITFKFGTMMFKAISFLLTPLKLVGALLWMIAAPLIWIGDLATDVFGGIFDAVGWVLDALSSVADYIFGLEIIGEIWEAIKTGAITAITPIRLIVDFFKMVANAAISVKEAIFGSSMFHIAEGIAEVLGPLDILTTAFEFISAPIRAAIGLLRSMWEFAKDAFGALGDIVTAPFKALGAAVGFAGDMLKGAWDTVTGSVGDVITGIGDTVGEAWNSVTDTVGGAVSTVGDSVSDAWTWLTGNSPSELETRSLEAIDNMGMNVADAYRLLESPWTRVVDGLGEAMSDAWNWLTGEDEANSPEAMMSAYLKTFSDNTALQGIAAPMYTSKFDEDTKRSGQERSSELVMLQQETVALLAKILEKQDPNSKRAAEAMEKIAQKASEPEQPGVFRSREGFGEHVTQWWISK